MRGASTARSAAAVGVAVACLVALSSSCHRQAAGDEAPAESGDLTEESQLSERRGALPDDPVPALEEAKVQAAWEVLSARTGRAPAYGDEKPASLQKRIDEAAAGEVIRIEPGTYRGKLVIRDKKDLTLTAEPGTVWIVSEGRATDVLRIEDSERITVQGLGLLHDVPGLCTGDAIEVRDSKRVTIRDCDLSGSGVAAVRARGTAALVVEHNHIHHCTYNTVNLKDVYGASVRNNLIRKNDQIGRVPEGVVLRDVYGPIGVVGNTFVDNESTPVTVEVLSPAREEALDRPAVTISHNLFVDSRSPRGGKDASIWLGGEMGYVRGQSTPGIRVGGNCFDASHGRKDYEAHVRWLEGAGGNVVGPIELGEDHRVRQPKSCRNRGALPIEWLEEARNPTED